MKKIAVIKKADDGNMRSYSALCGELSRDSRLCLVYCDCLDEIPCDADRALVFGGDGTVLAVARHLAEHDIGAAILGVNLGNLGFLTAYEKDVSASVLAQSLLSSDVTERTLLDVSCGSHIGYALNDAVVKSEGSHPIKLDLKLDGRYVDTYHGDGLIVSTAVGSTAYSLSAGGPVLEPGLDAFVINPICPHSLHSRPLVVSANANLQISINGRYPAHMSLDGESVAALPANRTVISIKKAANRARFVSFNYDFFAKLLQKMNSWGRTEN